jgi:SAM-dependent methyltransferase
MSTWRAKASTLRWRLADAIAHLPLLAANEPLYRASYFREMDALHAPIYEKLAEAVYYHVRPASVVDVGCGTGSLLASLASKGVFVRGLEGSRHAIAMSPLSERIVRCNLERGVPHLGRFDLCLCIEVAEHLPARCGPALVKGLAAMTDLVVFSAATPGQKGAHHINLRPHSYWINEFAVRGFAFSDLTRKLKDAIADVDSPAWYIHENLMVFSRQAVRSAGIASFVKEVSNPSSR